MANCGVCKCPLTQLRLNHGRLEPRKKCARCVDEGAQAWKPPKVTTVVKMKEVRSLPPVYRAPRPERTKDPVVLRIDEFINRRTKKRMNDG